MSEVTIEIEETGNAVGPKVEFAARVRIDSQNYTATGITIESALNGLLREVEEGLET